jgi:S1-C subfamily serine protease
MRPLRICFFVLAIFVETYAQQSAVPASNDNSLTRVDACDKFMPAVVMITVTAGPPLDGGLGTGFLVSEHGWIVTAAHVLLNEKTSEYYPEVEVIFADGDTQLIAKQVTGLRDISDLGDYAFLKVDAAKVPKQIRILHHQRTVIPLGFGDESNLRVGSDLALIGAPVGAGFPSDLCLSATVAGIGHPGVYYQGVAVEGMSGGPVISLESGKVVVIIRRRAAALLGLDRVQRNLVIADQSAGYDAGRDAVSRSIISDLVGLLSHQFNNGIGYATGVQLATQAFKNAVAQSAVH